MTEVARNVILDLLPLYLSGEASEETITLVKKYLDSDPDLAELAHKMAQAASHNQAPAPRTKEAQMEGFEKTKQLLIIRSTIVISLIVIFICTALLVIPVILIAFTP
jgi:hypothetical protein